MIKYSIVVPVFNRPDEVRELLDSLTNQSFKNFEIILVDGSPTNILADLIKEFQPKLPLKYFYERLLAISPSRNLGCKNAEGEYLIFVDSDCVLPPQYLLEIDNYLKQNKTDGFGGPDKAGEAFSPVQKAMSFAMTSFLTTGGIRGKKSHLGEYQLRGFNMGIRKDVFREVGGYSGMDVAEDIDLSIRIRKAGYKTNLITNAYVYHKRRATLYKFFRQSFVHGKSRIELYIKHRDTNALKIVHLLPTAFTLYLLLCIIFPFFNSGVLLLIEIPLLIYVLSLLFVATIENKSIKIGLLSLVASFLQLTAYGTGLIVNFVNRIILGSRAETRKPDSLK
ncbi:MAG: glycosyltransferase [Bacteroidota bacterium]|nr:glycosyltransferase [Bacteroidota bacterium]